MSDHERECTSREIAASSFQLVLSAGPIEGPPFTVREVDPQTKENRAPTLRSARIEELLNEFPTYDTGEA